MQDAQRTYRDGEGKGRDQLDRHACWFGLATAASVLLACASNGPAFAGQHPGTRPAPATESTVHLLPRSVVTSNEVLLSDVARLEGADTGAFHDITLAPAPAPGQSLVIDLRQVQQRLDARGVNLAYWVFRGSSRCEVSRPEPADGGRPDGGALPPGELGTRRDGESGRIGVSPDASRTLERVLKEHIAARLENLGGQPVVRFSAAVGRLLTLAEPTYRFRVEDRTERLLGLIPFQVTVFEGETVRQVSQVLAEVGLEKRVVVAARPINREEIITEKHLSLQDRPFQDLNDLGLTSTAPLIGQRARRFIDKGAMPSLRDVEPVPLVRRNDVVDVWLRRDGLSIKSPAKALAEGGYGDTITVKNERSRQTFSVVVIGHRTVQVPTAEESAGVREHTLARSGS